MESLKSQYANAQFGSNSLGINNTQQMIGSYIGASNYTVVEQVYNNLGSLVKLCDNLPLISYVSGSVDNINRIASLNEAIMSLYVNRDKLQAIYDDIDALSFAGKSIQHLVHKIDNIDKYLGTLYSHVTEDTIDELNLTYTSIKLELLEKLASLQSKTNAQLNASQSVLDKLVELEKQNKHLIASDAVNVYLENKSNDSKQVALAAIESSKLAGNDESINTRRLV